MEQFDLYFCGPGSPSTPDAWRPAVGTPVWLDGIDGFFDQYFEAFSPGDQIRFIAARIESIPMTSARRFLELPFVKATVLECESTGGRVRVDEVSRFADWATSLALSVTSAAEIASAAKLDSKVLASLKGAVDDTGYAAWVRPRWPRSSLSDTTQACVYKSGAEIRCVCFRSNAVPSILARLV